MASYSLKGEDEDKDDNDDDDDYNKHNHNHNQHDLFFFFLQNNGNCFYFARSSSGFLDPFSQKIRKYASL